MERFWFASCVNAAAAAVKWINRGVMWAGGQMKGDRQVPNVSLSDPISPPTLPPTPENRFWPKVDGQPSWRSHVSLGWSGCLSLYVSEVHLVPLPCAFCGDSGQCFTRERHPALQLSMKGCNHGDSAAVVVCLNNEMSYEWTNQHSTSCQGEGVDVLLKLRCSSAPPLCQHVWVFRCCHATVSTRLTPAVGITWWRAELQEYLGEEHRRDIGLHLVIFSNQSHFVHVDVHVYVDWPHLFFQFTASAQTILFHLASAQNSVSVVIKSCQ